MTDTASDTVTATGETVDLQLTLPAYWTTMQPTESERAAALHQLAELLADKVDDPDAVAEEAVDEALDRLGVGGAPLMVASFRLELDDGSMVSASLIVAHNELGGSLDAWRDVYPDHDEATVGGEPAVRTSERSTVQVEQLFDEPLTVCTWRYVVPFDPRSTLTFAFSTPNHELDDLLLEHFDEIMDSVEIIEHVETGGTVDA